MYNRQCNVLLKFRFVNWVCRKKEKKKKYEWAYTKSTHVVIGGLTIVYSDHPAGIRQVSSTGDLGDVYYESDY